MYTQLYPMLAVNDLEAEAAFYAKLGFTTEAATEHYTTVAYGDGIFFVLRKDETVHPAQLNPFLTWQIGVKSVSETLQLCTRLHFPVIEAPTLQPWGEWTVGIQSPNGYVVVFEGRE